MNLTEMSVAGSALILVTLVLRRLLGGRLPRWTMPILWWTALLRLLLPLEIPSPVSIRGLLPSRASGMAALEPLSSPVSALEPRSAAQAAQYAAAAHGQVSPALVAWTVGFTACAVALLWFWGSSLRNFRESLPLADETARRWLSAHPTLRRIQVRQSDRIDSPLTYGLLRPVILLPARRDWSEAELECVLAHEYSHIRHLDSLTKGLLLLAACVHWFNPLVWGMTMWAGRDLELRCDEHAARLLGEARRGSYALTLLRLEEARDAFPPSFNYFTTNSISERIETLMKRKKASMLAAGLALVLMFAAGAVFATSASAKGDGPTAIWAAAKDDGPTAVWDTGDSSSYATKEGGDPVISSGDAQSYLDIYGEFGLTYDETLQRFRYNGKLVRYFEDMYPVNEDGTERAGSVVQMPDGEVDVYSIRDLSHLTQNADGSYDPSGQLTGLREATQEEFDNVTAQLAKNRMYVDRAMAYAGEATSTWEDAVELAEDSSSELAGGDASQTEIVQDDAILQAEATTAEESQLQAEDATAEDVTAEEPMLQSEEQVRDAQEASKPR